MLLILPLLGSLKLIELRMQILPPIHCPLISHKAPYLPKLPSRFLIVNQGPLCCLNVVCGGNLIKSRKLCGSAILSPSGLKT